MKALITGITGQDGSYLAEYLLSKGYEVHGIIRRASTFNTHRIDHIYTDPHEIRPKLYLHYGDLSDSGIINKVISNTEPDEIYHFGAQSHVRVSFDMPEYTADITGLGTLRLLEAIRNSGKKIKFYQASSSELFGSAVPPQNENTSFMPQSPYAAAKLYAYWITDNYRSAYNLFACNGILFNHESPRRGETFVTRKISRAVSSILAGKQTKFYLGNLDAKRDWGFAPEFIMMTWLMLQLDTPEDFVVGTGESHSVREFVESAFNYCGVEIEWRGDGVHEKAIIKSHISRWSNIKTGNVILEIDPKYFRPTEVHHLLADISKAKAILNWQPKVKFHELVKIMLDHDLQLSGLEPVGEGAKIMNEYKLHWTKNTFNVNSFNFDER